MAKAVLALDREEQRIAFAVTRLEATRRFEETFVVLRSFSDLRPVTTPTSEEQERFRAIRRKYEPLIRLPASRWRRSWTMPVYVLWRNDLCLFTVTLDPVGKSTVTNKVLRQIHQCCQPVITAPLMRGATDSVKDRPFDFEDG